MLRKFFFLSFLVFALPFSTSAEMNSATYRIFSDAVGIGGGENSTSASYSLSDTFAEPAADGQDGSTYTVLAGFQAMNLGCSLSLSLSAASIALGSLSVSAVASGSTVATITACEGFTLTMSGVSGSAPYTVSDGAVSAGSNEYGVAVAGSYRSFSDDRAATAGLELASTDDSVSADQTTITFKAAQGSSSATQAYTQTITLTLSAGI